MVGIRLILLTLLTFFAIQFAHCQITYSVGRYTGGLVITMKRPMYGMMTTTEYRFGPSGERSLLSVLEKSVVFRDENELTKNEFSKEVARFKIMYKSQYDEYGYDSRLAVDMVFTYYGYSNKIDTVVVNCINSGVNIPFAKFSTNDEALNWIKAIKNSIK